MLAILQSLFGFKGSRADRVVNSLSSNLCPLASPANAIVEASNAASRPFREGERPERIPPTAGYGFRRRRCGHSLGSILSLVADWMVVDRSVGVVCVVDRYALEALSAGWRTAVGVDRDARRGLASSLLVSVSLS